MLSSYLMEELLEVTIEVAGISFIGLGCEYILKYAGKEKQAKVIKHITSGALMVYTAKFAIDTIEELRGVFHV